MINDRKNPQLMLTKKFLTKVKNYAKRYLKAATTQALSAFATIEKLTFKQKKSV